MASSRYVASARLNYTAGDDLPNKPNNREPEKIDLLFQQDYKATSPYHGFLNSHDGEPLMKPLTVQLGSTVGRSFIPLLAVLIILGTMLSGPWVTLLVAAALWYGIGHTL